MRVAEVGDHAGLHARLQPEALALADLASGRRLSYAALDHAVARCAGLLSQNGISAGDRVATLARNQIELAILHLSCARLGAIYVPLNWRLAEAEIAALLDDADPRLLIGNADFLDRSPSRVAKWDIAELPARVERSVPQLSCPINRERPSLILYTSGTSGRPKGVVLSEANLDQTAINFAILGRVSPTSVFLSDSPMFHVIGLVTSLRAPLMFGAALLLSDAFDPPRTLARMSDAALGVTHYFCVPQMAARLRADPTFDAGKMANRVTVFTGGAPHPPAAIMAWINAGIPIADGFGMSEAGTVFGMPVDCARIAAKAGSAGVPPPGVQARIVDAAGQACEDGRAGELQLRGANVTAGYWRRPLETRAAFTEDGWFMTGDVAVRDADGFYSLVDRKKDMFISGGENVYPAEIEAALAGFPGLAEAAVIGVPDERWGEVGHCAIVATPGGALDLDAVTMHLRGCLARYKLPAHVTVIDALPRTGSGKVQKDQLRTMLAPH